MYVRLALGAWLLASLIGASVAAPTVQATGWSLDIGDHPRALGWAAGANEIALGTAGGVLQIRRASDGFALFNRKVHEAPVTTLAWHPTQSRLAIAGEDGSVQIFQLGADEGIPVVRAGRRWTQLVAWSPKGGPSRTRLRDGSSRPRHRASWSACFSPT